MFNAILVCLVLLVAALVVIAHLAASVRRHSQIAASARGSAERATVRNTLLLSISHDLRNPLAAIMVRRV